ncbi:thiaminase/transcriptional activator TenA [Primorskyibacter sedentarius]|uniref:Aminopyrimidine aminohydrolase n=1 Tax=Primorskyibacter sedentarius TaxID=745311 RepID=A0A4R3J3J4_9RHOB|nr:thiaminase II [Primorskyibacter sedentarius]TCS59877.1 thiaminase/transcriptional activator TenA [Primorskyibacter sedentarius]
MSYGNTFPLWRAAAGDHWPAYTRHAFVQGLADGSLPRDAFMHYLVQDYIFLIHFSRAWALAVSKADTLDEMRHCAATVHALLNQEMGLHVKLCGEAGIAEADLIAAEERPENLAYTRYVLDIGHRGDFLDLLAALAPCVLGYGEIGARLAASDHAQTYAEWIGTYGSRDYQDLCHEVAALIDASVARRIGPEPQTSPRWGLVCERFTMATRLEVGFWDMGMTP